MSNDPFFTLEGMKRAFEVILPPRKERQHWPQFNGELYRDEKVQKALDRRQRWLAKKALKKMDTP